MEILGVLALLLIGSGVGGLGMWQWYQARRSEREVSLEAELKALRTAQRLSIATWRARQQMRVTEAWDEPQDAA